MPKFQVLFSFDGQGEVIIEAKNIKEAEKLYHDGEWENEEEWEKSYNFESIEKVK